VWASQKLGDLRKHFEILGDLLANVRTLDFDDDRTSIAELGEMHLAERSCGEGHLVKTRESLREPHPQFGHNNLLRFLEGKWLHSILQSHQRFSGKPRAGGRAGREDLS